MPAAETNISSTSVHRHSRRPRACTGWQNSPRGPPIVLGHPRASSLQPAFDEQCLPPIHHQFAIPFTIDSPHCSPTLTGTHHHITRVLWGETSRVGCITAVGAPHLGPRRGAKLTCYFLRSPFPEPSAGPRHVEAPSRASHTYRRPRQPRSGLHGAPRGITTHSPPIRHSFTITSQGRETFSGDFETADTTLSPRLGVVSRPLGCKSALCAAPS